MMPSYTISSFSEATEVIMKPSIVIAASVAALVLSACFATGAQCKQQMFIIIVCIT